MATGRSDFPNQVNNVLGFPFIFRGALDVRATQINEAMKVAAAQALAALAREDVPDSVVKAYGLQSLRFGPDYVIPKPVDPRVLLWEAPAIAQAAMESGVARLKIDLDAYREQLEARLGKSREVMRVDDSTGPGPIPSRVALAGGRARKDDPRRLPDWSTRGWRSPSCSGAPDAIQAAAREMQLDLDGIEVVDPATSPLRSRYAQRLYDLRAAQGRDPARGLGADCQSELLRLGDGGAGRRRRDAVGPELPLPRGLRPPLQIIKTAPGSRSPPGCTW